MSNGSTGQIVGTVVGAALGYFTGGASYLALGASLGGLAGGLLDPASNSNKPQQLDDLKVSVSTYGAGIPETYGNDIPPATWIWSTDIQEVPQYYSEGKGGGDSGPSSYFYLMHGLICLGKSPPPGIEVSVRKVFKDGKLIWDGSTGLSVGQALATEENPYVGIQLFDGNESQLPPAFIELWEGVGNVPGYRGLLTLLVVGLETPGGRVPQISLELCVGSVTVRVNVLFDRTSGNDFSDTGEGRPYFAPIKTTDLSLTTDKLKIGVWKVGTYEIFRSAWTYGADGAFWTKELVDPDMSWPVDLGGPFTVGMLDKWSIRSVRFAKIGTGALPVYVGLNTSVPEFSIDHLLVDTEYLCGAMISANEQSIFVFTSAVNPAGEAAPIISKWYELPQALDAVLRSGPVSPPLVKDAIGFGASTVNWDGAIGAFSADLTTAWTTTGSIFQKWEISTDGVFGALGAPVLIGGSSGTFAKAITVVGPKAYFVSGTRMLCIWPRDVQQPMAAQVAPIIKEQCERSDLTPDQIDVSTIDESIWGYTFNKSPASARSNIAPLLTYTGAAMVEEDGLIRFFHRSDKTPGETIPWVELGCVEAGQEAGDAAPLTRQQESECPRSLTVSYNNPLFDYQISTESVRRMTVDTQFDEQVTLELVMFPDQAASIAHRLMYERWATRNARSTIISRRYSYISPGDVHPLEYRKGTTGNFMAAKVTDTGALMEIDWIPADAELLLQSITGSGGYQAQEIEPLPAPTHLVVVDTAILQDSDNNAGVYAAMAGYDTGWGAAYLYAGADSLSLQAKGSVSGPAAMGFVETALTAYTLGNVDENNVVVVNVLPNALSAVTRETLLSGTANVAAVGIHGRWEIIKFQRADDLGQGRFRLSGLLRGLNGTEWAAGLHQVGDTFVLMSATGVLRPVFDVGSIGTSKTYKAVTAGRRYDSASLQTQIDTAEGLRPLSPTTLRKSFSSNDVQLTWGRRTRLANQWWLGVVPLGEESERYGVDIFSDNTFTTLKRTLSATTPSVTYASADQVSDFGSNQTTVNVRIYQISGTVGRGHPLQQSI